jgi:hypothetical protein
MQPSSPTKGVLDSGGRTRHPLTELLKRSRDPALVADSVARTLTTAWDLISPFEFSALYRQIRPYTMCSNARLRALYHSVKYIVGNDVDGELVECGCARGGSAALMALTMNNLGCQRDLWLFDTFAGLPAPTPNDADYEIANLFTGSCVADIDEVQRLFESFGVAKGVHLVKGLFQETLPRSPIRKIALLHIDGDWYESVKACLANLYDRVVPRGVIQFDDYGYWKGARKAVDEFMQQRGIDTPLRRVDYSGRSLLKPS